jgi:putative transposase
MAAFEALDEVCARIGRPEASRVDQESQYTLRELDLLAYANGVALCFSHPSRPTDNAYIKVVTGRFRPECLNAHWHLTLADAHEKIDDWYFEVWPHSAIVYKVLRVLTNPSGESSPTP